jgi:hypothetical protein
MFFTKLAQLSNEQAITASAASTNNYTMGTTIRPGDNIPLVGDFIVTTTFTATGASTLTVGIQNDNNDSGYTAGPLTRTFAVGTLVKGFRFKLAFDGVSNTYYQFYYTVGVASFTAGKISAFIRRA